jgi:hypothetical protein
VSEKVTPEKAIHKIFQSYQEYNYSSTPCDRDNHLGSSVIEKMAMEMVLIPKSAYERWVADKESVKGGDDTDTHVQMNSRSTAVVQDTDVGKSELSPDVQRSTSTDMDTDAPMDLHPSRVKNDNIYKDKKSDTLTSMVDDAMIKKFHENYRLYARRLLNYIGKNGSDILAWDKDDNTIIYKGSVVDGSNIIDLITHIFKTNRPAPKGLASFRKGMDKIHVPKAYLKPYLLKPPGLPKKIKKNWVKY